MILKTGHEDVAREKDGAPLPFIEILCEDCGKVICKADVIELAGLVIQQDPVKCFDCEPPLEEPIPYWLV